MSVWSHVAAIVRVDDIRGLRGGELDFDDVAGIVLIFLLHNDSRVLCVEIGDNLIEKIDRLNLAREEVHLGFSEGRDCCQCQSQNQ